MTKENLKQPSPGSKISHGLFPTPSPIGRGALRIAAGKEGFWGEGARILFLILVLGISLQGCAGKSNEKLEKVKVQFGNIKAEIPSTGIVEPRNRLQIKPPVAGRIDEVLAAEGQAVKRGQILAWMSSGDRAALLDAARAQGEDEVKRWEDVYKPTPIVAPLDGVIILRGVEPGQSAAMSDAIFVMSDHLIVKAQVDETDIGSIHLNQTVNLVLDAYPNENLPGKVEHIAYESKTVNNVTIYEVFIKPVSVPSFFRSGMSATVNFVQQEKKDVLVLPLKAVKKVGNRSYVFIIKDKATQPLQIKAGLENNINIEVLEGLKENDEVVVPTVKMVESLSGRSHRARGPQNPLQRRND